MCQCCDRITNGRTGESKHVENYSCNFRLLPFPILCLQLLFEAGIIAASAVSMTTGALSVVAGLPAAALISFLFRLREVKLQGFGTQRSRKPERSEGEFIS